MKMKFITTTCLLAFTVLFVNIANAQTQLITDGGFEAGSGGPAWTQSSTNFGTPICDFNNCGNGSGTGPRTGSYWAWFGGYTGGTEVSSVAQNIIIPNGATVNMTFWLEKPICDGPQDFLEVKVDGVTVFSTNGSGIPCGQIGYSLQSVNLSSYANGQSHTVEFFSTTFSQNGGVTNFFLDDVSILATIGAGGCPNIAVDGSFEAGPNGPAWTQSSTNFGTPLCTVAACGNGNGTGPRTGSYWSYFGGFATGIESGSVSQTITIPANSNTTLKFYLEIPECDGSQDFLEVRVDGQQVFLVNGGSSLCGTVGYVLQTVNLSAFSDGAPHTIEFNSTTFAANGGVTNFFIDDVTIENCPILGSSCNDTTAFNALNIPITDNDPAGITDSRSVTGVNGSTLGVDCKLVAACFSIDHTWVGDLVVKLMSPNGTMVTLLDRPGVPATANGCDGDNINVCVERGTGNEIENVCTPNIPSIAGNFTAANGTNLDAINTGGGSPNGTWQIFASDNVAFDTGAIMSWKLVFDDGPVANWNAPASLCATANPINLNTLVTGTPGGTWSGPGVSGNTFNPAGLSGPVVVNYTVSNGNCSDSKSNSILVYSGAPSANFNFSAAALTVYFTDGSSGATSYSWDFGDGTTSTAQNPSHTYATAGFYTVTLTVTNLCGSTTYSQLVGVVNCNESITDGGFETGTGSTVWTQTSTNFGTPFCDLTNCGNGGGTGPRTGNIWSWFGGLPNFEESSVSQTFGPVASNNNLELYFWLEQIACDGPDDFLKVVVDNDTVYSTNGASNLCGNLGYTLQTVDLSAYADGQTHTLKFFSRVYGTNGGVTNFFVDDVSLLACIGSGIDEAGFWNGLNIFPVPANNHFNIQFGETAMQDVQVAVYDVMGRKKQETFVGDTPSNHQQRIDTSSLSKGIYTVIISTEGQQAIRKIVIQ